MTYNKDKDMRDWEVTADGRVWPCCYFANGWDKRFNKDKGNDGSEKLFGDAEFKKCIDEDSNFNSLLHHDLDTVIDHPYFNETVWFPGWESDNPHALCSSECKVITDQITGNETTKSTLRTRSKNE